MLTKPSISGHHLMQKQKSQFVFIGNAHIWWDIKKHKIETYLLSSDADLSSSTKLLWSIGLWPSLLGSEWLREAKYDRTKLDNGEGLLDLSLMEFGSGNWEEPLILGPGSGERLLAVELLFVAVAVFWQGGREMLLDLEWSMLCEFSLDNVLGKSLEGTSVDNGDPSLDLKWKKIQLKVRRVICVIQIISYIILIIKKKSFISFI